MANPQLPESMQERAMLSMKIFRNSPNLCQIDDNGLLWCQNGELWLSVQGNYSKYSPKEKTEKRIKREEELLILEDKYKEEALKSVADILYWSEIRKNVLERDDYTCQLCGLSADTKFHIHHIEKKVLGGSDFLDNLITVCPKCHSKADRVLYNPQWKKK